MKKNVFHVGLYMNTTRVNLDKVEGIFEYLAQDGVTESLEYCRKNKIPYLVPYDIYMSLYAKFKRFDQREDKKKLPGMILFHNHDEYAYLACRDKIWYQHCPDCSTHTNKVPFKKFDRKDEDGKEIYKFDDIDECPECGKCFHISLSGGQSYI